ncbi:hypothetical protein V5739_14635 [Salinimicrobium sp. TIG7-5_MAKvit]|uniref:hypothetical protein n=1 Tax=Salinimicrobium sp. TIG7-5_MAKvit TaxID=3121289 RepID=UPI003C6DC300
MKKLYSLLIVIVFLASCQEKKSESNVITKSATSSETVNKATEPTEKQPVWTDKELRIHREKIEVGNEKLKMAFNTHIESIEEELKQAKAELEEIEDFEIGRSQATKDAQLEKQHEKIEFFKESISHLKSEYVKIPLHKRFDFQKNPKAVVEQLFEGFKDEDFENFRYLGDPYGEFDEEILWLTNIKALPQLYREDFLSEFKNSRIMGEPIIKNNKASIEVALGPSSNRLEIINLVKRLDSWYLTGI